MDRFPDATPASDLAPDAFPAALVAADEACGATLRLVLAADALPPALVAVLRPLAARAYGATVEVSDALTSLAAQR